MSRKELEIYLDRLERFENPDELAEQYPTPSNVAANLLWNLNLDAGFQDKTVIDLGAGTGILGIGAGMLGAKHVHFIDYDGSALKTAKKNAEILPDDVETTFTLNSVQHFNPKQTYDYALINPPFGTRNKGIDTAFLQKGCEAAHTVLSMHKTTTRVYIAKKARSFGKQILNEHHVRFPLAKTLNHHREHQKFIDVSAFILTTPTP